jgi:hypothetical protein
MARATGTRGLTRQGPLELPYVRDLSAGQSVQLMAAILDSTRRVGIADNIAVLGHFRPEFSHNIVTTWTHVGTLGVLTCSLVPAWELVAYLPTLNTAHPGRRERFRRRNKMWSLQ